MKVLVWEAYALDVWRKLNKEGNVGEISVKIDRSEKDKHSSWSTGSWVRTGI